MCLVEEEHELRLVQVADLGQLLEQLARERFDLAIVGGGIYIYVTVGSLLWGKRLEPGVQSPKFTPIPFRESAFFVRLRS